MSVSDIVFMTRALASTSDSEIETGTRQYNTSEHTSDNMSATNIDTRIVSERTSTGVSRANVETIQDNEIANVSERASIRGTSMCAVL
jgi:hypothetical protein